MKTIEDVCKLCNTTRQLCNSHVIPEFFFKSAYDELHRAIEVTATPIQRRLLQKGYREKLLCKPCEERINKFEKYVYDLWFKKKILPKTIYSEYFTVKGIDYHKFKLFHLSVLWRASVSSLPQFSFVELGPHEKKIKDLILNETPGDENRYGFFGSVLVDDNNNLMDGPIMQPISKKIEAHRVFIFIFGGCQWFYFTSSHTPARFVPFFFKKDGLLGLLKQNFYELDSIQKFARAIKNMEMPKKE